MKNKFQRVSEADARTILNKLIADFKSKTERALIFDEDYAGGNQGFINQIIVDDLIKKLTR